MEKISKKQLRTAILVFAAAILFISIIIRYPKDNAVYFDNDAPYHVLLTMQAYDETPAGIHKFLPLVSLGNDSDKYIPWGETVGHDGNYYYTSFSAAPFVLAYFFCKAFSLDFTIQSLYIFSSLIYIICTGLSVLLALKLFKDKLSEPFLILISVFIFGFQTEILNSLGAVYWAQSIFQIVFLAQILLFLSFDKKWCRITFFVLCAIAPYIEWTGFISNVGFALAFWLKSGIKKDGKFNFKSLKIPVIIGILTIVGGMLFILHFLSVLPLETVIEALKSRFSARSAAAKFSFFMLFSMYWKSFGPFLIILAIALIAALSIKSSRAKFIALLKEYKLILIISAFALLENIVLKEHAIVYSYDRMKAIILLFSLFILCLIALKPFWKNKTPLILALFLIISCFNLLTYTYTDNFYKTGIDYLEDNKKVAEFFETYAVEDESIMAQPNAVRGYSNLLFGRGIYEYYNEDTIIQLAREKGKRYAVLLLPEGGEWGVYNYKRFNVYDIQSDISLKFEVVNHEITEIKE